MLPSIIHSAVMAGIFAKLPMLTTHLVIFDTAVVDLTGRMDDPVETLMSVHLGGGTDIAKAMGYCKALITAPRRTIVVLVSDLCEGGSRQSLYRTCHDIVESGARLIALTALNEHSVPDYTTAPRPWQIWAYMPGHDGTSGGLHGGHHAEMKGGKHGTAAEARAALLAADEEYLTALCNRGP